MVKAASTKTSATKAKATKAKATKAKPTAKKAAEKKTATKSAASKVKTSTATKKAPAKQHIHIPKGWPVSSKPTQVAAKATDDANDGAQSNHLTPGNLLKVNCNGSDVFLRKRATQPTSSLSLPTSSKTKGATRFLVVFPGRLSLKPPEKKSDASKLLAEDKDDEDKDDEEGVDGDAKEPAKKKSPFAPTNPPQLLGKLKEGPNNHMQLKIPFEGDESKQLIFSGRAIPIDGKFLTLSFKRTGGKDSKKNGKVGTGSIICKDVFRSVIVLGDKKFMGEDSKPAATDDEKEEMRIRHYGGSERTVDGGGQGLPASRKSIGAKRDSLCSTKSSVTEKSIKSSSESNSESDAEEINKSDPDSDGEFVPTKKRKKGEEKVISSEPKRTSRRSASKALNVSYADEESDVDMDKDASDLDGESKDDSPSESEDEFDELLDNIAKKPRSRTTKPKPTNGKEPSTSSASAKKRSHIEVDSGDEDDDDDVVVIDSNTSTDGKKKTATSRNATKQVTKNAAAKPKPKKAAVKSPSKSSVSPRKRKKTSPHKSPSISNRDVWELSDDSFSFL
jgi:hypothetical protein